MTSEKDLGSEEEHTEDGRDESLLWEFLEEGEFDYQRPRRGEIRDGVILRKGADQIIVDIGAKREGIVPERDLEKLGPEAVAELEAGDEVPVYVLKPENNDGDVIVSINLARQRADWTRAEEVMEANEILEEEITGFNKGGLLVQFGNLQGFLPRSHIVNLDGRTKPGPPHERLNQMVGKQLPLRIIEVNQRQRRLIVSERSAWREWRAEQKKHLLADLEVDDIREGTVTSLADFGAFIDLGGADGLIHLSELSWDRGKKPGDVVQIGEDVKVKVISLDRDRQRIGLSLKQLKPDPWQTMEDRYTIGQYIDVEITNLANFGAFARLEEGIEGLIHISELADHNVQHPGDVVEAGQELTIQILSLEPERKRVGLSLRRVPDHLRQQPEAEEAEAREPEEEPQTEEETDVEASEMAQAAPAEKAEPAPTVEATTTEEASPDEAAGLEASVEDAATPDDQPTDAGRKPPGLDTSDGGESDGGVNPPEEARETAPPPASVNGDSSSEAETEATATA